MSTVAGDEEAKQLLSKLSKLSVIAPAPVVDDAAEKTEEESGFVTPTGKEYRIPEPVTCPPAPKPNRSCSRPTGSVFMDNNGAAKVTVRSEATDVLFGGGSAAFTNRPR